MEKSLRVRIIEQEVEDWPEPKKLFYWTMIADGQSPQMAHQLASRRAPTMGLVSERQFDSSHRRDMNSMSENLRNRLLTVARSAGIDTHGKYYVSGLGKHNDPRAWVSSASEVKRVCEERQMTADGPGIRHTAPAIDVEPNRIPLAEDVVQERMGHYIAADPGLAEKVKKSPSKRQELRERVIETHAPKA